MPFKFLCFPGAYTNAQTLRVQLGLIVNDLESDGFASFHFTQGEHESPPFPGFESTHGNPPNLRFLPSSEGLSEIEWQSRVRFLDPSENSEDTVREVSADGGTPSAQSMQAMLDPLHRLLEEEGPFQGVLGYSEGASVAATLLISNQRRCEAHGIENTLTHAIFFSGVPPRNPDGDEIILADRYGPVIKARTVHVLSSSDPFLHGCLALYNLCEEEDAKIFDHGKGHVIPRDPRVIEELGAFVRGFFVAEMPRQGDSASAAES